MPPLASFVRRLYSPSVGGTLEGPRETAAARRSVDTASILNVHHCGQISSISNARFLATAPPTFSYRYARSEDPDHSVGGPRYTFCSWVTPRSRFQNVATWASDALCRA